VRMARCIRVLAVVIELEFVVVVAPYLALARFDLFLFVGFASAAGTGAEFGARVCSSLLLCPSYPALGPAAPVSQRLSRASYFHQSGSHRLDLVQPG
jgi:hypothetical protein